jgi:hypothetical protein
MPLTSRLLDTTASAGALQEFTRRVQAEYTEMPGLCVTLSQAQRLWAVDRQTCESVFRSLMARGFLRMTKSGRFIRSRS